MTEKKLHYHASQSDPRRAPRSLRIVVVDDNRDAVLSLMMLLRDEGHDVRGVHSGERAMQALEEFPADVVILDIAMPDESGWELARRIRKRHRRPPMLIAISAVYQQEAAKVLALLSGIDHYLVKPHAPHALLRLLGPLRGVGDAG